ncbi:hypothetical protein B0H13DRAFT_2364132 [Mycena leptocephala]|nr:hypothetical protein B0H13DRAFT_2364132 [Mycena leptocephala]
MADIVGLVASILKLVDAVVKARDYIKDFRNAPRDQQQLLQETEHDREVQDFAQCLARSGYLGFRARHVRREYELRWTDMNRISDRMCHL